MRAASLPEKETRMAMQAVPPMTRPAHYAALALAQWTGGGLANLTDLRATFPALVK